MKTAIATLRGISAYQQGRYHGDPKLNDGNEGNDAYEQRTWKSKAHVNKQGHIFIPGGAFKNCLSDGAKYLNVKIKGKGQATYTKHFLAGVSVINDVDTGARIEEAEKMSVFCDSQGKRGGKSGSRVMKYFPTIMAWEADVTFFILDDVVTEDIFHRVLSESGMFIGIGVYRPQNGGHYGRFSVEKLVWKDGMVG